MSRQTFQQATCKTINMTNIEFLLQDKRNCRSDNLKKFFRNKDNKRLSEHWKVIRFEEELWFVTLGWLTYGGKENGFAGVKVKKVACYGAKAESCYPSWQKGGDYEDVTDWFWSKYRERGIISIPEIWHREIPKELTHKEHHTI